MVCLRCQGFDKRIVVGGPEGRGISRARGWPERCSHQRCSGRSRMNAAPAARVSGLHRWGFAIALAAVCGCPRPPLTTEKHPPRDGVPARPSVYFATNRNVDLLFLIDDSSSMRLSQDNLQRNFPVLHDGARGPARRPAQPSRRGHLVGHGRGRRIGGQLRFDAAARTASSSTRRAAAARRPPRSRRDVHLEHRGRRATTPATSRTCSPASPRSASRAAASSTSSRRSCARSAPTAAPRPPRTRASCAPTR